ncbi:MAG: DNA repair protein RecO [Candidatus Dormibacteraeota bacterium]|nr:DNA repair protein RecO [Candidatus Dormibacteraeota bacterium]
MVLRKLDYGEADRIYTLLTRGHGKLGAIGKGVRKTTSKLASALEIYSQVDVLLAHGRNLDVIAQVERKQKPRIEADLERTSRAALIAELAERMSEDRHPVDYLYDLTCWALDELAVDPEPRRASAYFLAVALDLMGYAPELATCARCQGPLAKAEHPFSAAAGGFLCPNCGDPAEPATSPAAIKVLRVMFSRDLDLYRRLKLSTAIMDEVDDVLADQLEYHLDRRLNTLRFLRRMRSSR